MQGRPGFDHSPPFDTPMAGGSARLDPAPGTSRLDSLSPSPRSAVPRLWSQPEPQDASSPQRERRWTINGDFLTLKATGIARFAREVTTALDELIAAHHPLTEGLKLDVIAPGPAQVPLNLQHIPITYLPELRPRLPQVWVQLQLPHHLSGGLLSFCNLAPIRADRHIACIHDLQTRTVPESYGRFFRLAHRLILPRLARHADLVTTVSAFSKATFVGFGLCPSNKIVVVPNGCDHALQWKPERATRRWRETRPFVLCMGRDEAHKNIELVWRLAPCLDVLGVDVVVAGAFDPTRLDRKFGGRPDNIRCLSRVSDDDLARGLEEALCFLFPSKTEGFGLPAVEAMARGCPVVASLSPAMIEVCGSAALFADADDLDGWIEAVRRLLDRPDDARDLAAAGRKQADRFRWRDAAKTYLRLMAQVDESRDRRERRTTQLSFTPVDLPQAQPHYR